MAITPVLTESQLLIKVGDAASPEVFAHPCMINLGREFAITHNYSEDEVPDCDTPTNPHKILRYLRSKDFSVSGNGKVDAAGLDFYMDWAFGGTQKNVQVLCGPTTNGRYIAGAFYCQFSVTGEPKANAECTITLTPVDTGALTINDVS